MALALMVALDVTVAFGSVAEATRAFAEISAPPPTTVARGSVGVALRAFAEIVAFAVIAAFGSVGVTVSALA